MYPFKDGCFAPRNAWYVAAFAKDVGRNLTARIFLNEPVVLYRTEQGEPVAVGGRCPHRHFPLGAGMLDGNDVVCGYHGIAFGPDGRCTHIPAQDSVPGSYRIPTYPLVEHGLWLWIWMGDPVKADESLLPPLDEIWLTMEGMHARAMFFHEVACRYQLLNDNLLDLTHLGVLHGSSIGTKDDVSTPETLTQTDIKLSSRRTMADTVPPPVMQKWDIPDLRTVNRVSGMDFYLPGFHAGVADFYHGDSHPARSNHPIRINRVYHAVTPSTPDRTYYWFGMATNVEDALDQSEQNLPPVIAEDIFASEEIEKMLRLVGGFPRELMIKTDQGAVIGRRLLQRMMDLETTAP